MDEEQYLAELDALLKEELSSPPKRSMCDFKVIIDNVGNDVFKAAFACASEILFDNPNSLEKSVAMQQKHLESMDDSEKREFKTMIDSLVAVAQQPDEIIQLDIKVELGNPRSLIRDDPPE